MQFYEKTGCVFLEKWQEIIQYLIEVKLRHENHNQKNKRDRQSQSDNKSLNNSA